MGLRGLPLGAAAGVLAAGLLTPALYLDLPAQWLPGWTAAPTGAGIAGALGALLVIAVGSAAAVRLEGAHRPVDGALGGARAGAVAVMVMMALVGGTAATVHGLGPLQVAVQAPPVGEEGLKPLLAEAVVRVMTTVALAWLVALVGGVTLGAIGGVLGQRGAGPAEEPGIGAIDGLVGTIGLGWGVTHLVVLVVAMQELERSVAAVDPGATLMEPMSAMVLLSIAVCGLLAWRAVGRAARRPEGTHRAFAVLIGLAALASTSGGAALLALAAPDMLGRPLHVGAFVAAVAVPLVAGVLAGLAARADHEIAPTGATDALGGGVLAAVLWTTQSGMLLAPGLGIALAAVSHIAYLTDGSDPRDPVALVDEAYWTIALWTGGGMLAVGVVITFVLAVGALFTQPVAETADQLG